MNEKKAFLFRIIITTIIVFVLWSFFAKQYAFMVDSLVGKMIWNVGYFVERSSAPETSLLSPLIPFLILMISTWGLSFIYIEKRVNTRLIVWSLIVCILLFGFTILGQYLAVFMVVSNTYSQTLLNLTSFFIATTPVLIPVIAWYALSKEKLTEIIKSEK